MEDTERYALDDSFEMGLSYIAAVLDERDDDAATIEELNSASMVTSLLQVNIALLAKLLELIPEEEAADGQAYLETLRAEHWARTAKR